MCTVHLRVVELERKGKGGFQPRAFVLAPNDEGIVEDAAIHANGAVYLVMGKSRGAYDHAFFREIVVNAASCYLSCKMQIVIVELLQILVEGYVA